MPELPTAFREVFPTVAAALQEEVAAAQLEATFEPARASDLDLLLVGIRHAQRQVWNDAGLAPLEAVSRLVCDELEAAQLAGAAGLRALRFAALCTSTLVAVTAFQVGDVTRTHEWLLRAVVDDYHGDDDYEFHVERLLAWTGAPTPALRELVADGALTWLACLYAHGERSGDLIEYAEDAFGMLEVLAEAGAFAAASSLGLVLDALMMRAQWAMTFHPERARPAAAPLVAFLQADVLAEDERAYVAAFVATAHLQLTERPQRDLAAEALEHHGTRYDANTRLRLHIVSCWGDAGCFREAHTQLLVEVAALRDEADQQAASPTERLLRQGQAFRAVGPVLRAYAEAGETRLAVELLAAWSSDVMPEALIRQPTFAVPAHPVGTLWSVAGQSAPPVALVTDSLGAFTSALNGFLGTHVLVREGTTIMAGGRILHPNEAAAPEFERASLLHLRLDAVRDLGQERLSRTLVLAPGLPLPVQPLLLRELNAPIALSVSLREPARERKLARAALLGDNTMTSPLELEAVEARFRAAGIDVVRLASTAAGFREAYADASYDVIWVAAHGEYEAYELERSALVLGAGEELSIDELSELGRPVGERRALVLNVCSGGLSATLGGQLGLGLGPVLAGPTQTVLSHLWPSTPKFASAFGVLCADALIECADHLDAYARAVRVVLRGRESILEALRAIPASGEVAERVANSSDDYASIAAWGSPVLLV